ncbi:hypothetical protein P4238_11985 [Pseudomonas aeruginosa]|nr:hypothetical protein [Pseudomonas aeruginosa]
MLREVEEHGRQHIFLYKCLEDDAQKLLNRKRIETIAGELGLSNLLSEPLYVEMPEEPQVVDIRIDEAPNGSGVLSLTVKVCECRQTSKLVGDEYDEATSRRYKTYEIKKKRAISIAKLSIDGTLELRIASRDNSTKYHEQISELIRKVNNFFNITLFHQVSLSTAKDTLFKNKEKFEGTIRYSNTTARNDFGVAMNLSASNLSQSLLEDNGSNSAMKEFLSNDGFVTGSNIWFILPEDEDRQIHVILSGETHEFAVTGACTSREYSYVLGKILSLN